MNLQEQKFGVELEFTGITRQKAAKVIADYFGTDYTHEGGSYDKYSVYDDRDRKWQVMYDGSISSRNSLGNPADSSYRCELVTPVCDYDDITKIQEIIRGLRGAKARVNNSCGIHIHVDGSRHTARSLKNLTNIIYSKEDMMVKALQIDPSRLGRWCRKVESRFLEGINNVNSSALTVDRIKDIWYNGRPELSNSHYDSSRYRMLNYHSYFQGKGIEFRCFNSTLHAGKMKAYIQFCLAVSAQAINQEKARAFRTTSSNECYTFRTWLIRIGLNGDEFKTCRLHLLNNLEGAKDRKHKSVGNRCLEQRAMELAADIEEERLRQPERQRTATEEIIEQHREERRTTTVNPIIPPDNTPPQELTLAEQVDAFLASISNDVTVSEEQRERIIDILCYGSPSTNRSEANEQSATVAQSAAEEQTQTAHRQNSRGRR